jgi:hypothetical protein
VRTFTVVKRDERKVKEALLEFSAAARVFANRQVEDGGARYFVAQATIVEADVELEKFLAIVFPTNLDFSPDSGRQASMKRFSMWLEDKKRAGSQTTRKYETVLAVKDAASSITAAERLGIVSEMFASMLGTTAMPRGLAGGGASSADARLAYCDAMGVAAEPLEGRAAQAYGVCLAKSAELSWFDDSSRFCEEALLRMRPEEYPRAAERRGSPRGFTPVIASEPAIRTD